jgi:hypothetical protein
MRLEGRVFSGHPPASVVAPDDTFRINFTVTTSTDTASNDVLFTVEPTTNPTHNL